MIKADMSSERNPLRLEASADEREAEALRIQADALCIRAMAKRRRAELEAIGTTPGGPTSDLDERAAAKGVGTSVVTFKRAHIEPDYFVGTRPRWRDAESVRAKFAARGKVPTTPEPRQRAVDDVDVSSALASGGLRAVGGGRR